MYKFKNKINDIWNIVKKNKRFKYLSLISILMLFCLALNVTFAKYTTSKSNKGADITIGDLKYKMIINDTKLGSSVGTKVPSNTIIGDRIILSKSGKTEQFNIMLTSLNNFDTKYEITYRVCTDKNCTKFIDTPKSLSIMYNAVTPYIFGTIGPNKNIFVSLVTDNTDSKDYYIEVGLSVGYNHNKLALSNQISLAYNDNDITIIAYVDGVEVSGFPNTVGYIISSSTCEVNGVIDSNIKINGYWDWTNAKWIINVNNISKSSTVCNINFETAPTLVEAIRKNYPTIEEPKTTPGLAVSESSEKVLASAQDDYGTSYYFRGAIDNNYVEFANKCWRIVRITGDGSIKLVLHNDNVNKVANPCTSTNNDPNASFARYQGTTYTTMYNSSMYDNAYVGFMYGVTNAGTYGETHANTNKSIILQNLEKWYNTYISAYESKLADTIWCNDKSSSGAGIGINTTYYNAFTRTRENNGVPILVCPNDDLGGKLSKFTVSDTINGNGALDKKIGLLTVDEVAFAGADFIKDNKTYYLYENAFGTYWWTMSSQFNNGAGTAIFSIGTTGAITGDTVVKNAYSIRPAISLKDTTIISKGTGTSSDPFVVS